MLGRAASLQAGRKENRWPTGGRGSRVGPHSGLDPKLLSGPRPLDFSLCSPNFHTLYGLLLFPLDLKGNEFLFLESQAGG